MLHAGYFRSSFTVMCQTREADIRRRRPFITENEPYAGCRWRAVSRRVARRPPSLPVNHVWQRVFFPAASPVSPPCTDDGRPANWCTPDWKDALQSAGASRAAADCGPFNAALPCAQHSLNHRLARWLRPRWGWGLSPLDRQCREKTDRRHIDWETDSLCCRWVWNPDRSV